MEVLLSTGPTPSSLFDSSYSFDVIICAKGQTKVDISVKNSCKTYISYLDGDNMPKKLIYLLSVITLSEQGS